jgi:hypothetical protein
VPPICETACAYIALQAIKIPVSVLILLTRLLCQIGALKLKDPNGFEFYSLEGQITVKLCLVGKFMLLWLLQCDMQRWIGCTAGDLVAGVFKTRCAGGKIASGT